MILFPPPTLLNTIRRGVPMAFALIIGEREAEAGRVAVRDMTKGEQHSVALEEVTGWLSQRLD